MNFTKFIKSTLPVVVIVIYLLYYDRWSSVYDGSRAIINPSQGGYNLISSDVIRGYNDTIILYFLLEGESYGYEISKNIKEHSNEKYIMKETTLYSAFNRLENNGYIESFYGEETFGKRRTYYRITPSGVEYYKEKCKEWILTKDVINRFIKE